MQCRIEFDLPSFQDHKKLVCAIVRNADPIDYLVKVSCALKWVLMSYNWCKQQIDALRLFSIATGLFAVHCCLLHAIYDCRSVFLFFDTTARTTRRDGHFISPKVFLRAAKVNKTLETGFYC